MTLTEVIIELYRNFQTTIIDMNMNNTNPIELRIDHKFKEEMIVPYCAIDNNIAFLL